MLKESKQIKRTEKELAKKNVQKKKTLKQKITEEK